MAEDDRYRLGSLREARAVAERGKQHALASRLDDTRALQAQLDAARARTLAARNAVTSAVAARDLLLASPPVEALAVQRIDAFIARRRRELAALLADEVRLEAGLDTHHAAADRARGSLIRARSERELIDRHFARWREARRKAAERRDG